MTLSEIDFYNNHESLVYQLKMKLFELIKTLYFKKFSSEFDISSLNFSFTYKDIVKIAFI